MASTILDVAEILGNIGLYLRRVSPEGVTCLMSELASFRAERLPWRHSCYVQTCHKKFQAFKSWLSGRERGFNYGRGRCRIFTASVPEVSEDS